MYDSYFLIAMTALITLSSVHTCSMPKKHPISSSLEDLTFISVTSTFIVVYIFFFFLRKKMFFIKSCLHELRRCLRSHIMPNWWRCFTKNKNTGIFHRLLNLILYNATYNKSSERAIMQSLTSQNVQHLHTNNSLTLFASQFWNTSWSWY